MLNYSRCTYACAENAHRKKSKQKKNTPRKSNDIPYFPRQFSAQTIRVFTSRSPKPLECERLRVLLDQSLHKHPSLYACNSRSLSTETRNQRNTSQYNVRTLNSFHDISGKTVIQRKTRNYFQQICNNTSIEFDEHNNNNKYLYSAFL